MPRDCLLPACLTKGRMITAIRTNTRECDPNLETHPRRRSQSYMPTNEQRSCHKYPHICLKEKNAAAAVAENPMDFQTSAIALRCVASTRRGD